MEIDAEELEETSQEHDHVGQSVMKNMTAEPEEDQTNNADLCRSRAFDDVIQGGQEVREHEEDTVPDDAPDQPSSPRQSEDHETSSSADINDRKEPTMSENIRVQSSLDAEQWDNLFDESVPTLQSAAIDCTSENNVEDQPSPGGRQRPLRNTSRPKRFRDAAFDTQFQPKPRRRSCKRVRRQSTTGNYLINKEECLQLGSGEGQKPLTSAENKDATPVAKQQKVTQTTLTASITSQNRQRRYPCTKPRRKNAVCGAAEPIHEHQKSDKSMQPKRRRSFRNV